MDYITDIKDALIDEGHQFCQYNSVPYATTADGDHIVRCDDIRKALDKCETDPRKYYPMHEVPHIVWCLNNGIYGV